MRVHALNELLDRAARRFGLPRPKCLDQMLHICLEPESSRIWRQCIRRIILASVKSKFDLLRNLLCCLRLGLGLRTLTLQQTRSGRRGLSWNGRRLSWWCLQGFFSLAYQSVLFVILSELFDFMGHTQFPLYWPLAI